MKQFLRITNLIDGDLNVIQLDEKAFATHIESNYNDGDLFDLQDFMIRAEVGDDVRAYRWNGKPSVVVRTR